MRRCPYCKVDIAGDLYKCPLCQSKLMGAEEEQAACYPQLKAQKKRSFLYKLQLLLVWAALIVGLGLDFTVGLRLPGYPNLHWSLLLAMWLVAIEFGIIRQFKPGTGSAGKVSVLVLITVAAWCVTSYFFGLMQVTFELVVPSVLAATIIANFVLALIDRHGNNMAYLLSGLFLGVVPGVILFIVMDSMPLAWAVCLMISIILFAGAVIFRGKAVKAELQRRFHV
ncbi:MAG: hypothetical protein II694_10200 [Lachnospiraceae bacterium]|nr:hypothetical protein [Lachnospiraceae bacterium]